MHAAPGACPSYVGRHVRRVCSAPLMTLAAAAHLDVHLLRHRPHLGKSLRLRARGCQDLQCRRTAAMLNPKPMIYKVRARSKLPGWRDNICSLLIYLWQVAVCFAVHAQCGGPVRAELRQRAQLRNRG